MPQTTLDSSSCAMTVLPAATSVIWGMPGSAVEAGVCSAVLPLEQIGPKVVRMFLGARS